MLSVPITMEHGAVVRIGRMETPPHRPSMGGNMSSDLLSRNGPATRELPHDQPLESIVSVWARSFANFWILRDMHACEVLSGLMSSNLAHHGSRQDRKGPVYPGSWLPGRFPVFCGVLYGQVHCSDTTATPRTGDQTLPRRICLSFRLLSLEPRLSLSLSSVSLVSRVDAGSSR